MGWSCSITSAFFTSFAFIFSVSLLYRPSLRSSPSTVKRLISFPFTLIFPSLPTFTPGSFASTSFSELSLSDAKRVRSNVIVSLPPVIGPAITVTSCISKTFCTIAMRLPVGVAMAMRFFSYSNAVACNCSSFRLAVLCVKLNSPLSLAREKVTTLPPFSNITLAFAMGLWVKESTTTPEMRSCADAKRTKRRHKKSVDTLFQPILDEWKKVLLAFIVNIFFIKRVLSVLCWSRSCMPANMVCYSSSGLLGCGFANAFITSAFISSGTSIFIPCVASMSSGTALR